MKLKNIKFLLTGVLCAMLFISCHKPQATQPGSEAYDYEPDNPYNKYDSFGYWHNQILDYIEDCRNKSGRSGFSNSCNSVRDFYKTKSWADLPKNHFANVTSTVEASLTDIQSVIKNSRWSNNAKKAMIELIRKLENASSTSADYSQFKNQILEFEDSILQTYLPESDKEVILKTTSTARYSSHRWIQRKDWHNLYNASSARSVRLFKSLAKWFVVTLCDIGGAIADMDVASGAECSDYMSQIIEMHE